MNKYGKYKQQILRTLYYTFIGEPNFRFVHLAFKYYSRYNGHYGFLKEILEKANIFLDSKVDYWDEESIECGLHRYLMRLDPESLEFDNFVLFNFDMYARIINQTITTYNPKTKKQDKANNRLGKGIKEGKYNKQMFHLTDLFKKIGLLDSDFNFKKVKQPLYYYFLKEDID